MNGKVNIATLITSISEQTGLPQAKVRAILSGFLEVTRTAVADDNRVILRGFGSFFIKQKKGRKYRDIRTGTVRISAPASLPAFQPSKVLLRKMRPSPTVSVRSQKQAEASKPSIQNDGESPIIAVPDTHRKKDVCEVIVSVPNRNQTDDLRIRFTPTSAFDSPDVYPIVYSPVRNSFLKLPREGRSDVRGYKEPAFLAAIRSEFPDIIVSDNLHMKIPGRYTPYEPDIVLFDDTLNLYIDVEIDEPYDGYSRLVTHIIEGRDTVRDIFFKESGWVVVRFTEKQVHLSCDHCIHTLRNIVDTMRSKASPIAPIVLEENRWNRRQAIQWEKDLYREKYLGIQFFAKQVRTRKVECRDKVEGIDLVIERSPVPLPVNTVPGKTVTKSDDSARIVQVKSTDSPKDIRIPLASAKPPVLIFNEGSHTYSTPGDNTGNSDRISVTTLIDLFFPHFDEDAYIKKRMEETGMSEEMIRRELAEPSERGTDLHKQIENYLKDLPYDDSASEFQHFLKFYQEQIVRRNLVFDSAEYAIELKGSNIAGTVDALFRKPNGEYVMVDWKRSKHLIIDGYAKKYGFGRGLSVLSHLDNSSYYKYEIQQSFYKYILEKDYGIKVSSMILAVLYPGYDRYYSIKLSDYRKQEVLDMIESYENIQ